MVISRVWFMWFCLFFIRLWWVYVIEIFDVRSIEVLSSGIFRGLSGEIFVGG